MATTYQGKTLIVIVGPTAVGKTSLAIKVARHFGAQIISADSRQIFRELEVGTAKPSAAELSAVAHHFINTHSIGEEYDAAAFGEDARERIEKLFVDQDYVVMCGGSGLYIKAAIEGLDAIPAIPDHIRQELIENYESSGLEWLQQQLQAEDPEQFARLDTKNPHRLIRALEVKRGTGSSLGDYHQRSPSVELPCKTIIIGLDLPREELYGRIDERMDRMIDDGLFEEAQILYPKRALNALQTVGYREIFDFFDGLYDREEAVRLLKRNTRRYAKRQLTWFRRQTNVTWFHPGDFEEIIRHVKKEELIA